MNDALVFRLADIAALAQQQFQARYADIDPVIGINRQLRKQGFAIDLMTIDCHVSKRRVTLLFEDAKPEVAGYQFGWTDKDPESQFESMPVSSLTQQGFYELMCRGLVAENK
ncbi:MAG TPA: hypothetical protein VIC26_10315 [Marinagarivorans sp.]